MGFMKPKMPPPAPPPPNPAITANEAEAPGGSVGSSDNFASLISTTARGLKRRASTQRTSLIGGA